jgi:hypothetical protein
MVPLQLPAPLLARMVFWMVRWSFLHFDVPPSGQDGEITWQVETGTLSTD